MKTNDEMKNVPSFDDLVFENRNKDYGAYQMRKKYNSALLWSMLVSVFFVGATVITPYYINKGNPTVIKTIPVDKPITYDPTSIPIDLKKDELQKEAFAKIKPPAYVAPEVVDSVGKDNSNEFLDIEDLSKIIQDGKVEDDNTPLIPVEYHPEIDENKIEDAVNVSEKPFFGIGGDNEFRGWISKNIHYPEEAIAAEVQGRVYVKFVVEKDGSISNVKVSRSVDPELDKEAIRVIEASPKWNPGKQQGKPVRVNYYFPITFTIVK
jgi:periplasmic protein TonB